MGAEITGRTRLFKGRARAFNGASRRLAHEQSDLPRSLGVARPLQLEGPARQRFSQPRSQDRRLRPHATPTSSTGLNR
jgi:hypothetical protein